MRSPHIVALILALGGISLPGFVQAAQCTEAGDRPPPMPSPVEGTTQPARSKLAQLIADKLNQFVDRKPDQAAVESFYRGRDFQPLWSKDGLVTPRARAAIAYLTNVAVEGLDPRDYPTPDFSKDTDEETAAVDDLKLTASLLKYVRHASAGRVSFTRVSGSILYLTHPANPAEALEKLSSGEDIRDVLAAFEPQHPEFKTLKAELAKVLASATADGAVSKPGFEASRAHKVHDPRSRSDIAGTLIANMERWRWLPRRLGADYVMVNIPDYSLSVFENGKAVWRTKIVAGKPGQTATPLLTETMKYLTINPTWNVPPSIIRNEYLPALERDPDALERVGLKIGHNPDGSIRVYQPPGDRNALGRIRFNFPNPFLVYQHDTPDKHLFARDKRAFSHGCMRVQNPERYPEVLLTLSQPDEGFSIARIRSLYGNEERTVNLRHPIPVHITYQTAFVDQSGKLNLREDVYGIDASVLKLMRGDARLVADIPVARNYESSSKPIVARLPSRHVQEFGDGSNSRDAMDWDGERTTGYGRSYRADHYTNRSFDRAVGLW